ncbi:MAG TPA: tryptophan 7-halogenase [Bryobacteraceae bacterium]|nr:tryptophan 7-halogenase [Bryobacteraceae bacterium]
MNNNHDAEFDVIVVGGGPGGSTVATFVAMQGRRVLLLEKQAMPAYKIGESLLPATVHGICPMLGVSKAIQEANFMPKLGGTFRWGKGDKTWDFLFSVSSKMPGPTSTAYQVERMKFDTILLDNARKKGVDVREQHSVTDVLMEDGRVAGLVFTDDSGIVRRARARYVVDASGHQTSLARLSGERIYSKYFQNLALFGYFHGGGRLPAPNQGNIFCISFEHGWFWYIPLTDTLTSVGAVVAKELGSLLTNGHEATLNEFIRACPPVQRLLANATRVTSGPYGELRVRKDYSYSHTKFWVPGMVLVGDSACFIDPVFSSGVHLATYSALLAARSINTCLRNELDEQRCFSEFEARYRREYALFYDFLLAFYDLNNDLDSYFWHARRVTSSPEIGNRAFIDLVAGVAGSGENLYSSPEEFFRQREGLGKLLFPQSVDDGAGARKPIEPKGAEFYASLVSEVVQLQAQATLREQRPAETPLFPGGLVASPDGLHWREVASSQAAGSGTMGEKYDVGRL